MKGHQLNVVDLFAGCGGLGLGLEQAGFRPIFVNELNDDARNTYISNRSDSHGWLAERGFHSADVREMVAPRYLNTLQKRFLDLGVGKEDIDLVVGGPPCQGFSGIGHRRSYAVDRSDLPSNHLYAYMATIVEKLQPKAFVFENVRGLLNAKWSEGGERGEIWKDVWNTFQLPGYSVAYSLVFAKDYGVPQNRPRVLMVGYRNDVAKGMLSDGRPSDAVARGYLPRASGKAPDLVELLGDLVDPDYENGGVTLRYPDRAKGIQRYFRTLRGSETPIPKGGHVTEQAYTRHNDRVLAKFRAMHAGDGRIPPEFQTKKFAQRRLPATWPAEGPSITATSLADDYVHFSQPRILTVREWARLQMFPDWYEFSGKRTTGGIRRAGNPREGIFDREVPKYTQIGNAVPVGLARAVGEHIKSLLQRTK